MESSKGGAECQIVEGKTGVMRVRLGLTPDSQSDSFYFVLHLTLSHIIMARVNLS